MSTFNIQPLLIADIPAVIALAGVIWRRHYPGIITHAQIDYMLDMMYAPGVIEDEITAKGIVWLKAVAGGRLIGFASYGPQPDGATMKLHKLYLVHSARGKGYGTALINHIAAAARAAGRTRLLLAVNKRNTASIAVYKRNGFVIEKEVKTDIGHGYYMDDFLMVKSLAGPQGI
ncbi:GNAT family N-acetyltransferase [bacterium]|nr:GNAT family N-acetyltransferase [bacterium]